jgi:hypothetical protein
MSEVCVQKDCVSDSVEPAHQRGSARNGEKLEVGVLTWRILEKIYCAVENEHPEQRDWSD